MCTPFQIYPKSVLTIGRIITSWKGPCQRANFGGISRLQRSGTLLQDFSSKVEELPLLLDGVVGVLQSLNHCFVQTFADCVVWINIRFS